MLKIRNKVKEFLNGQMEESLYFLFYKLDIKVTGQMVNNMDLEPI